jgi:hypothetical protein
VAAGEVGAKQGPRKHMTSEQYQPSKGRSLQGAAVPLSRAEAGAIHQSFRAYKHRDGMPARHRRNQKHDKKTP